MDVAGEQQMEIVMGGPKPNNGDVFPDGTVYVDISPSTHEPMFTTPEDVEVRIDAAQQYIRQLNENHAHGHNDWRLGDKHEIDILLANKKEGALSGTFNARKWVVDPFIDEVFPPIYLSSEDLTNTEQYFQVEGQRDGIRAKVRKDDAIIVVRPVRSGPV
jgi:hypothetical protein